MKLSVLLLLTTLLAVFCVTIAQETVVEEIDRQAAPSPDATEPFVCTNPEGRAVFVGRCICFLLFKGKIKLKNRGMAKRECVRIFGGRNIIKTRMGFCRRFKLRGGGRVNRSKIVQLANKFRDICEPDNPIVIMLNMMMKLM